MITFEHKGGFTNTENMFNRVQRRTYLENLDAIGKKGVAALAAATPMDTGVTSASWRYEITDDRRTTRISWYNTNVNDYVNIAMILQYGHATRNGGWVKGVDYINPAMKPIFDQLLAEAWEEVTKK